MVVRAYGTCKMHYEQDLNDEIHYDKSLDLRFYELYNFLCAFLAKYIYELGGHVKRPKRTLYVYIKHLQTISNRMG